MISVMNKAFYIFSTVLVLATACNRELTPDKPQSVLSTTVAPQEGDMARVTFKVTVPETALYATQTRAQHAMGEQPAIANGDLYVAVFGAGQNEKIGGNLQNFLKATLKETIVHDWTDEQDATKKYTYVYDVLMPLSNDPLVVDFLVGACDSKGKLYTLENPLPVKYENEVMPLLYSCNGYAAYWQRKRINGVYPHEISPGVYEMTQHIVGYDDSYDPPTPIYADDEDYVADYIPELDNVQLVRNFAKITYTVSDDAPFTLDGFYLVDTPKTGAVAPYSEAAGYNTAYTTASTSGAILGAYNGHVLSLNLNSGIGDKQFKSPGEFEYMYERTVPSVSAPVYAESGAIVKVTWKSTSANASLGTRYYKIAFMDESGYIPILRNIQYDFEISDIIAETHPTSAAAAYAGGWLGDVSANVSTSMLDEIGNGKSRIVVAGEGGNAMSHTAIGEGKYFDVDFYFYPVATGTEVVVTNGKTSTSTGKKVTITTDIIDNSSNAISSIGAVVVTHKSDDSDDHATIRVNLTDSEPGKVKTGKVRILGQVEGLRALYRDVVFTVMEQQKFETTTGEGEAAVTVNSSVTPLASDGAGQETTVTIQLPEGLPRDIFPLQIMIESEKNSIYSVANGDEPALPVKSGDSAFGSKNNYYFVKTITFDDYATLNGTKYDYTTAFPCKFKTRLSNGNATSIKINDLNKEYFVEKTLTLSVQ